MSDTDNLPVPPNPDPDPTEQKLNSGERKALGWIFMAMLILAFVMLICVWPLGKIGDGTTGYVRTLLFDYIHMELALFLIVMICGALGSIVFVTRSFAVKVGNNSYTASWIWWSILRIPVGVGIALMLYLVLRGGLFNASFADPGKATDDVNPFGFAAIATLAGMFARQAAAKLEEIFDILFKSENEAERSASAATPSIKDLKPDSIPEGTTDTKALLVTLTGNNFPKNAQVSIQGKPRAPATTQETAITVQLDPADVAKAGDLEFVVLGGKDQKTRSNSKPLTVTAKAG